jgi:diketogulonate reductase-like aldo/keto reductase
VLPQVNQIELSPYNYLYRQEVVDLCRTNQIQPVAYSSLTKGKKLKDPALMDVAATYVKTPAQTLIRWALQHEFVVIPESVNPDRIRENADVFDFAISGTDMDALDGFNEDLITGWDPTDVP